MAEGRLNTYHLWRREILEVYPTVIYMPYTSPMPEISQWMEISKIDYQWHISRYNVFDFQLGYDFFFRQLRDASFFRLAWGGTVESLPPSQFHLYFLD